MNAPYHDAAPSTNIRRRSLTRFACLDSALPDDLAEALWNRPEKLVQGGETLQRSSLRWTVRLSWASRQYVMKHYRPTWWHAVRQLVRRSSAKATWVATHRLADGGIVTPRPVACIENRWGGLRRDSFLMYPYVDGRTLRSYLSVEAKESRQVADHLWQQLGKLWKQLEWLGVSLEDTNANNFIVGSDGRLWVIDLDRTRFHVFASMTVRYQQRSWQRLLRSAAKS